MATHASNPYELHDHSGARWLAGASGAFALVLLTAVMMLLYPHL